MRISQETKQQEKFQIKLETKCYENLVTPVVTVATVAAPPVAVTLSH